MAAVVNVFSVAIVCLGLSAAVAGKWLEKVGPRLEKEKTFFMIISTEACIKKITLLISDLLA